MFRSLKIWTLIKNFMFCASKEILSQIVIQQPDFILHLDACVRQNDKSDFTYT